MSESTEIPFSVCFIWMREGTAEMNNTIHSDRHRWDIEPAFLIKGKDNIKGQRKKFVSPFSKNLSLGETAKLTPHHYTWGSIPSVSICVAIGEVTLSLYTRVYESLTDMLSMAFGRFWSPLPCFFFFPPSCCFFAFLDISCSIGAGLTNLMISVKPGGWTSGVKK